MCSVVYDVHHVCARVTETVRFVFSFPQVKFVQYMYYARTVSINLPIHTHTETASLVNARLCVCVCLWSLLCVEIKAQNVRMYTNCRAIYSSNECVSTLNTRIIRMDSEIIPFHKSLRGGKSELCVANFLALKTANHKSLAFEIISVCSLQSKKIFFPPKFTFIFVWLCRRAKTRTLDWVILTMHCSSPCNYNFQNNSKTSYQLQWVIDFM